MSANILIRLDVTGLASLGQAVEVKQALSEVMDDDIARQLPLVATEDDGDFVVRGASPRIVSISGVQRWEPEFRAQMEAAVKTVTSEADVSLFCPDVDLNRANLKRRAR